MSYKTEAGEKDGVKGTFYVEEVRGGPGGYPYTKRYFVPDSEKDAVDTRYVRTDRPWEAYKHTTG